MFPEGRIGASKILEGTQEFWDKIHAIESTMPKEVQQLFEQEFAANPEMQMLKNASVFKTRAGVDVKEFMRTAAPAVREKLSRQMAEEEEGVSSGISSGTKWTARQAQDLRSNLGSLMSRVQNSSAADTLKKKAAAAATKAYASISQEMKDAADDAGVRDSFDQYNAVKRRLEKMIDGPLGKILGSDSGHEVAEHLATGKDRTRELVQSLGKYGLDPKTVQKFMSDYGEVRPYTGPTDVVKRDWSKFIAGYAAGIGLQKLGKVPIPAYVYGLGAGVGWPAVKRAITALQARKLPQEIIGALSEREIPAPLP
jgi:hypothetical protein